MKAKQLIEKALLESVEPDAFLQSIVNTVEEVKAVHEQQVDKSVELVLEGLKKVESRMKEALAVEAGKLQRGLDGQPGPKGDKGADGKPGKDGKDGRDGFDGKNGLDGKDGENGISVTDARIDFDGSLVIVLSDGREINAGEVVGDVQDRTAVITQLNALLPDQSGNSGKYLTTDGNSLSWASVSGGSGTVTSVAMTVPTGLSVSGSPVTTSGTFAVTFTSGYSIPTTASQTNWDTAYSWGNHASAGYITASSTATLTNKRFTERVSSTASASSVTPDISSYDIYVFTALAANLTINAPTGTPVDGDRLMIRLLDNGTSRTLTWNATFTAIGVTLPTATTANKTTYVGCMYNAASTRWDVIAVTTQA